MENEGELNVDQGIVGGEDTSAVNSPYNLHNDLHAISAAYAGIVEPNPTSGNTDEEFGFEDFVNAELEGILCQEDDAMYGGEPNEVVQEDPVERSRWFPFKNKMELVGLLLIGHTHSMISRAIYNKVRAVMLICDIQLPAWSTIRSAQARIKKFLKSEIITSQSPFGTPCFTISIKGILSQVC
ncbi:hypothetical protein PCASD_25972 [Puccinia coronata f. sp. avenae]|uniref:Uncharacterized protein n=1 Tax=Puccinia coronata f. sp. avenae TaxID=200324 RepID=A0A2N5TLK8_9BASI|nr:hypothetical protein PCASD_25972 [Puccinia coronata f. sp. avenae]